jgi:hypothetical protein
LHERITLGSGGDLGLNFDESYLARGLAIGGRMS